MQGVMRMLRVNNKRIKKRALRSYIRFKNPLFNVLTKAPVLKSRGNRPLQMTFEDQLDGLIYFHLNEFKSGRHLMQVLEKDKFAREVIAPKNGIKKSSFFEAINSRGLEQLMYVFNELQAEASKVLPEKHAEYGDLVAIDGSLVDAVLSMHWAEYTGSKNKAKVHLGFDLNHSIPTKIFLAEGNSNERPYVDQILKPGQTGITDRGYLTHKGFDTWQNDEKHFICRIKENARKTVIKAHEINKDSIVFYDANVLLGIKNINLTENEVRVVGYRVRSNDYWIATDRFDLSAEQIAAAYKLRWDIENFFAWWKRHLKVYHIIARSEYGLKVQMIAGLITYLLLAIYCHEEYKEKVSIKRVRELRINIQNEARYLFALSPDLRQDDSIKNHLYAKT
jgi:DDE family transposase